MSQTFTFPVNFQAPVTINDGLTGTFYGDGSNLVGASLPGQEDLNTVVQSSSATTWNYQGTDLKELSANWENTYTAVQGNSGNWNEAYNISTEYQNASALFATGGLQTTLEYLSTNNIVISSADVLGDLVVYGTLSAVSAAFVTTTNTFVSNITSVSSLEVSGTLVVLGDILSGSQSLLDIFAFSSHSHLLSAITDAGTAAKMASGDFVSITEYQSVTSNWETAYQQTSANDLVRSNETFETPTTGISAIQNIVSLSQATYDALDIKLPTTLYVIV